MNGGGRKTTSCGTPFAHHAQRLTIGAVPGSVARRTFGAAHQPKKILRLRGSHLRFEPPLPLPDSNATLPRHIPKQDRSCYLAGTTGLGSSAPTETDGRSGSRPRLPRWFAAPFLAAPAILVGAPFEPIWSPL